MRKVEKIAIFRCINIRCSTTCRGCRLLSQNKVVRRERWQISRQRLQRCAPHTRNHIYHESKYADSQCQTAYAEVLNFAVVRKLDLAQEVQAEQREDHNPNCEIDLAIEQIPVVNLVGNTEELEAECHLDKAKHNLHRVEPAAALWQLLQQRREECKECKWQRKGCRECQHCDNWRPHLARGRFDKHRANDRTRARERHQHERQSHKEDSSDTALIRLRIALVHKCARHSNLECTEERCSKDHKYNEKYDVWQPMCCKPVEDVGSYGIATHYARNNNKCSDRERIERNDKEAVQRSIDSSASSRAAILHKERHGHRHHREYTRSKQCCKAPQNSLDDKRPQRALARSIFHSLNLCLWGISRLAERNYNLVGSWRKAATNIACLVRNGNLDLASFALNLEILLENSFVLVVSNLHHKQIVHLDLCRREKTQITLCHYTLAWCKFECGRIKCLCRVGNINMPAAIHNRP